MADFRNIRNIFNAPPSVPPKASPKVNPGPGGANSATLRSPRPANHSIPSQAKGLGENGGCSKALDRTKKPEELISTYDHGVMHHDVGAGKVRKNTYVFQGAVADAASPSSAIPKPPQLPKRPSVRHHSPCPLPPEPTSQRAWRPGAGQAPLVNRPSPSSPCPPEVARTSSESPNPGSRGEGTPQRRKLPSKAQLGPPPAKPPRPPGGLNYTVSPVVHVPVSARPPRQDAAVEHPELYVDVVPPNDEEIYDDVVPTGHEEEKEDNEVVPSDKYFRRREGSGDYDDIVSPSRGPAMCGDIKDSARGHPAHRESGEYDDVMLPESTGSMDNNDGYFTVGECNEEIYDDIDNYCSTEESDSHPDCGMTYWPDGAGADAHAPTNSAHSQGARDKPMADWRKAKERQPDKSKTRNKELLQLQKKFNVHLSEDSPVMCCAEVIQPKSRALKKLELAVAITDAIEILHLTDEYAICRNQHGKLPLSLCTGYCDAAADGYVRTCQLHTSNVQEFQSSELYADVGTSFYDV